MTSRILIALSLLLVLGCIEIDRQPSQIPPEELITALSEGTNFELLSVNPHYQVEKADGSVVEETIGTGKFPILGKTEIKDAKTRLQLIDELKTAIRNPETPAKCFFRVMQFE